MRLCLLDSPILQLMSDPWADTEVALLSSVRMAGFRRRSRSSWIGILFFGQARGNLPGRGGPYAPTTRRAEGSLRAGYKITDWPLRSRRPLLTWRLCTPQGASVGFNVQEHEDIPTCGNDLSPGTAAALPRMVMIVPQVQHDRARGVTPLSSTASATRMRVALSHDQICVVEKLLDQGDGDTALYELVQGT